MAERRGPASGLRRGPRPLSALGALSGALLAVSLVGAALGLAPEAGAKAAPSVRPVVAGRTTALVRAKPSARTTASAKAGARPKPAAGARAATASAAGPAPDAVRPAGPPVPSGSAAAVAAAAVRPATHAGLAGSTPLTVALPSIGLTAPLLGLGLDSKGAPELPPFSEPRTAGWLRDSATPGAAGTAVLVGHVDTRTGPAVFWNLSAVPAGSQVAVTRVDGSTALFTVDAVRVFARASFPSAQVYGPAKDAQLRIITCGGVFDRKLAEYTGNVVVFAHLSGVRPAAG
jgi:hypothetical protein